MVINIEMGADCLVYLCHKKHLIEKPLLKFVMPYQNFNILVN